MLISEVAEVRWNGNNKKHYTSKGYKFTKMKDVFYAKIEDLKISRKAIIEIQCDYCGDIFKRSYAEYIDQTSKSIIKKDCCYDCRQTKAKEGMLLKYGVDRNVQMSSVKTRMSEKRRLDSQIIIDTFNNAGLSILTDEFDYRNSMTPIKFICNKHQELGIQETTYTIIRQGGAGCKQCRYDKISNENCHMWKGGTSPLHTYLRGKIREWKQQTMERYNYKCGLTGLPFDDIHHIYGFNEIVNELLDTTNIPRHDEISKYTDIELKMLEEQCVDLHNKYGLGICLVKDLHKLYHAKNMGNKDTQKEFNDFKNNYLAGMYDDELKDGLKAKNLDEIL